MMMKAALEAFHPFRAAVVLQFSIVQTKKKSLVASHFIGSTINTGQLTLCFVVVITNLHAMSLRMHCSVLISTCTM